MNQKGIAPIVIILIIIGLLVLVGGAWYWQNQIKQPAIPSITVLSPNGGETLIIDSAYTIRWRIDNIIITNAHRLNIRLINVQDNKTIGFIGELSVEDIREGSHVWGVDYFSAGLNGRDVKPGSYRVEINLESIPECGGEITCLPSPPILIATDQSDAPFTIVFQGLTSKKTYRNEQYGFEFKYPEDIFALVQVIKTIPPDYKTKHNALKLISVNQLDKLGKKECSYGLSGLISVCEAEMEGGIEFILVDNSLDNLIAAFDYSHTSTIKDTVSIAGGQKSPVVKYSIGAEGEGIDYYYIPLSQMRTLVIVKMYRFDGFPNLDLFNQVLSTLYIK